jgi:hypothetical protein
LRLDFDVILHHLEHGFVPSDSGEAVCPHPRMA